MEISQTLSIESFSYSWLANLKPSFESLDESLRASIDVSDEASFIEMDPKLPPSERFFRRSLDFNFDLPASQPPLTVVHADQIISNGFLMPLVKPSKVEANSTPTTPISSHALKNVHSASKYRCSSLRKCRRISKRLFQKYLDFLRPLYQNLRGQRSGSKTEIVDGRMQKVKRWIYSPAISPRASVACSADSRRRSCDSESSIHEAVLHCKRSIGK